MKLLKNRKRLDNKGFTLIELLAVVVILAVVMGIATSSVLTAMNKARAGSLADTAISIAQIFNQKYTEALVDGVPSDVFGDEMGSTADAANGYNFQATARYYIDPLLADTFNISDKAYKLQTKGNLADDESDVVSSFVSYNETNGKFVVCMVANKAGNVYVAANAVQNVTLGGLSAPATATTNADIKDIEIGTDDEKVMIACSDGAKSW